MNTPAPALTDERVRMFYACAYAWRTEDSIEDGERDLSETRARQGDEFDRWLAAHDAAVISRAKREAAEEIAQAIEAVNPVEWALAGQYAGRDAAVIARKVGANYMPDIDLDVIDARLAAATPGPWDYIGQGYIVHPGTQYDGCGVPTIWTRIPQCDADADLIAHAPTDLTALVAEVRSLRDVAEAAEAMLTGLIVDYDAGNTDRQMNDLSAALDAWRGGEGK